MTDEPKTLKEIDDLKYRVSIEDLKLGDNYKDVKRESIDKLKRSLLDDDQLLPILTDARIDHDGVIIGGYHQYFAIKELIEEGKWLHGDKVWVEPRTPKDDKHAKILALKHNTQYDIATTERLAEYGADLIDSEYMLSDIPIITDYQVISLIDIMDRVGPETEVTEDESPEVDETVEPTSKLGRVYQLGRHRLMCGDSTKIEDVEKLMNGQKADMVFTDPPFNIDLGHITNAYESHDDNMNSTKYQNLLSDMLGNLVAVSGNTPFYVMSSNRDIGLIKTLFNDVGIHYHQLLIWAKPSGMMGNSDYIQNYEAITYGYTGEHKVVSNKGLLACEVFNKDENITTVGHPTSRPIELLKKFISNSSSKDDVVVDLFGGSGSTLIACEQLDRTCYMMEIDPRYCDVIRKRYAKFIGKEDTWENESPII